MKIDKINKFDFETTESEKQYEIYEDLYREYIRKVEENDRQFKSLQHKEDIIIMLKEIINEIIGRMV